MYGEGLVEEKTIKVMLDSGIKLIEYGPAPASGLYLKKVEY